MTTETLAPTICVVRKHPHAERPHAGGHAGPAITPCYMETDNTEALRADAARHQQITDRISAGRWGQPQDLAGAALYLASRASDYVNGHVLVVDGGWMGR